MPTVLQSNPSSSLLLSPKKKFRTVLGLGSLADRASNDASAAFSDDDNHPVLITTHNTASKRRSPSAVTDPDFYANPNASKSVSADQDAPPSPKSDTSSLLVEEMKIDLSQLPTAPPPQQRSSVARLQPQWGPWSVSAAEAPHAKTTYNLYIKTPTHHLTLTRTAKEITELHTKLRDTVPNVAIPPLPISPHQPSQKRRGSFLHTLSRFTNNSSNNGRLVNGSKSTTTRPSTANGAPSFQSITQTSTSALPTPLASPGAEMSDPFAHPSMSMAGSQLGVAETPVNGISNPSTNNITTLAAYLTTISNDSKLRTSRPWKRFVRVRTDDLESSRIERAIKRVRSDVAIHTSSTVPQNPLGVSSTAPSLMALGLGMGSGGLGLGHLGMSGGDTYEAEVETSSEASGLDGAGRGSARSLGAVSHAASTGQSQQQIIREEDDDERRNAEIATTGLVAHDKDVTLTLKKEVLLDTPSTSPRQQLAPTATPLPPSPSLVASALPAPTPADIPLPAEADPEFASPPPSPSKAVSHRFQSETRREDHTTGLPTPNQSPHGQHGTSSNDAHPHARIPRSASADPDKATRLSRVFKSSPLNPTASLLTGSADGDRDSSSAVMEGDLATDVEGFSAPGGETEGAECSADGEVVAPKKVKKRKVKRASKKVVVDDFDMMRVLGKGCAGKVLLVKHKESGNLYALKAITKRHVLAHQELQHTLTEQAVLKRMAREGRDPFVVKLWWSFHDKDNLFLVMDFHPGGDLATQLARWGRLGRDRARFYAAEIVEGVDGLHAAGVVYRDLKPENILIGADGHIVLTDFGLSKEFARRHDGLPGTPTGTDFYSAPGTPSQALPYWMAPSSSDDMATTPGRRSNLGWNAQRETTTTFCGTAEYLAPEVIQGLPYSYEVDWWSFGTMLYEMLSGITPFWANNHSDMYVRVLQDELTFPDDKAMDHDTKSLIRGLLQRNPALRMSEPRIKRHPYFSMIDWEHVYYKRYIPPYIPPIDPSNASDTQNFDEAFLDMDPIIDNDPEPDAPTDSEREKTEDDRTDVESVGTSGQNSVNAGPSQQVEETSVDVFDGYSFKGRHSIILDDEDELADEESEEDPITEEAEVKAAVDALVAATATNTQEDDAASETGTIEIPNETEGSQRGEVRGESASPAPSSSAAPDSIVTASITTDNDSVTAMPVAVRRLDVSKQASESSADTSTLPSLSATTTTPSGMSSESPITSPDGSLILYATRDAVIGYVDPLKDDDGDAALRAPLPLSPIFETSALPSYKHEPPSATAEVDTSGVTTPAAKPVSLPVAEIVPATGAVPHIPVVNTPATPVTQRQKSRREKSGVHALDRSLDTGPDHDEDWDLIEAPHGEDRNGAKGASLWQRGVVDRYRLAVFKKSSEKRNPSSTRGLDKQRSPHTGFPSSASGATFDSETTGDLPASPSPSENKQRRGRTTGLSLRKSTKQFLRAKSPPTTWSVHSSAASRSSLAQSATTAMAVNSNGLLTPSPSGQVGMSTKPGATSVQSLKSKSSALSKVSVSSPGSSDQSSSDLKTFNRSASDVIPPAKTPTSPRASPPAGEGESEKHKNLWKMKKFEERAEKVFSLFSGSPRSQNPHQQHPPTAQTQAPSH